MWPKVSREVAAAMLLTLPQTVQRCFKVGRMWARVNGLPTGDSRSACSRPILFDAVQQ